MLAFQPPLKAFIPLRLEHITLTPVPLNHSRPTFGYLIETPTSCMAYLTDTVGLPDDTWAFLEQQKTLDSLVVDCTAPPCAAPPRNHNDVTRALEIHERLQPRQTYLTHISHEVDVWLLANELPRRVQVAKDGMSLAL